MKSSKLSESMAATLTDIQKHGRKDSKRLHVWTHGPVGALLAHGAPKAPLRQ